jgi:hypothetical protein
MELPCHLHYLLSPPRAPTAATLASAARGLSPHDALPAVAPLQHLLVLPPSDVRAIHRPPLRAHHPAQSDTPPLLAENSHPITALLSPRSTAALRLRRSPPSASHLTPSPFLPARHSSVAYPLSKPLAFAAYFPSSPCAATAGLQSSRL